MGLRWHEQHLSVHRVVIVGVDREWHRYDQGRCDPAHAVWLGDANWAEGRKSGGCQIDCENLPTVLRPDTGERPD